MNYLNFLQLKRDFNFFSETRNPIESDENAAGEEDELSTNFLARKKMRTGRKINWPETLLNDIINIIVTSVYFKKRLIFQSNKIQKNAEIYGKDLKMLTSRAHARDESVKFTIIQLRK